MDCSSHLNVLQDGGLMQWEGNRNEIEENSSNYWSKMLQLLWDCDWCRKRAESLHSGHVSVILCSKGLYDTTFWWKLLDTGQNLSQCSEKLIKGQQQCRKKKKKMEGRQLNARKFRRWRWWVKIDGKKKKNESRMRKRAERKWCDSRTLWKAKGEIGSVRWIERGDCVLFWGHHSFTHGIRGRAGR